MREIKFRAFGKNSKEFLNEGKGLTLKEIQNIENIDEWEFQEFTSLTDKNGVEIFEGDVVKPNHTWAKWMDNWTISVKWNDKHSRFQYWNHDLDEWADGRDGKPYIIGGKYSEIIGNIYENPELLEGGE